MTRYSTIRTSRGLRTQRAHRCRLNLDDVANVGAEAPEGTNEQGNQVNFSNPGNVTLGGYSYRTPIQRFSIETFTDITMCAGAINLFRIAATLRIAQIVGKRLVLGSGSGQPTGLVTALLATGNGVGTIAAGANANDGLGENGQASVGSSDLANLYSSVDPAYRIGPQVAWLMNDNTFAYLQALVTKQGLPLVSFYDGAQRILGKPVKICPSMDNLGSAGHPIAFGDLSYFAVRCVRDANTYVRVVKEAPGLIENGEVGLQMCVRFDSNLLFPTTDSGRTPIKLLQNHS